MQFQSINQEASQDQMAKMMNMLSMTSKDMGVIEMSTKSDLNQYHSDPHIQQHTSISDEKFDDLERRLRAIESRGYGCIDLSEFCMVQNIVIPPNFKLPEFEKFSGNSCPETHLKLYCTKMAVVTKDEKLFVHFFHESLSGAALKWYLKLDKMCKGTWRDLVHAFRERYNFYFAIAPTRTDLQNMEKGKNEIFKAYAQRWREKAAEVDPPLTEHELLAIFIDTLKSPFFDYLVGSSCKNFSEVVNVGERIEMGLKNGRLTCNRPKDSLSYDDCFDEESEVDVVIQDGSYRGKGSEYHPPQTYPMKFISPHSLVNLHLNDVSSPYPYSYPAYSPPNHPPPYSPLTPYISQPFINQIPKNHYQQDTSHATLNIPISQKGRKFSRLPVSMTIAFQNLLERGLISHIPQTPVQPPFPRWYDPNVQCEYHAGNIGHSTEKCRALRNTIQDLIDVGQLDPHSLKS